jgi:hypothetical protein
MGIRGILYCMALSPEDVVRAGYLLDQRAEDGEGGSGWGECEPNN